MKQMGRMKVFQAAITLVAVLAMNGTGWAKKGFAGPGVAGDLDGSTVTVYEVTIPTSTDPELCPDTPVPNAIYTVKGTIFQPSGRMLGMALGTPQEINCNLQSDTLVDLTLQVVQGLTLKKGPATLLYQVFENGIPIGDYGSRVDLH